MCSRLGLAVHRERHLQGLSSEPLAASLPPPKRRKTAAAAAKAPAAKSPPAAPAPRAASAPVFAARNSAKEEAAAFSSEDSPDEDDSRPAPRGSAASESSEHEARGTATDIPRPDTRHYAELAARLEAEMNRPARSDEGRRRSDRNPDQSPGCAQARPRRFVQSSCSS